MTAAGRRVKRRCRQAWVTDDGDAGAEVQTLRAWEASGELIRPAQPGQRPLLRRRQNLGPWQRGHARAAKGWRQAALERTGRMPGRGDYSASPYRASSESLASDSSLCADDRGGA